MINFAGLGIVYIPAFNIAFFTRALEGMHFTIPGMPFACFEYIFDEIRKSFVRVGDQDSADRFGDKITPMGKWFYERTYY